MKMHVGKDIAVKIAIDSIKHDLETYDKGKFTIKEMLEFLKGDVEALEDILNGASVSLCVDAKYPKGGLQ